MGPRRAPVGWPMARRGRSRCSAPSGSCTALLGTDGPLGATDSVRLPGAPFTVRIDATEAHPAVGDVVSIAAPAAHLHWFDPETTARVGTASPGSAAAIAGQPPGAGQPLAGTPEVDSAAAAAGRP